MRISKKLFSELEAVSKEYAEPALPQTVFDYEKYRLHQIVGSSTRLAGATLTDTKVKVLLEQGRTTPGKLLEHHLMVQDNFRSMQYALAKADSPPYQPLPVAVFQRPQHPAGRKRCLYHTEAIWICTITQTKCPKGERIGR